MRSNGLTLAGVLGGVLGHANWVNTEEGIDVCRRNSWSRRPRGEPFGGNSPCSPLPCRSQDSVALNAGSPQARNFGPSGRPILNRHRLEFITQLGMRSSGNTSSWAISTAFGMSKSPLPTDGRLRLILSKFLEFGSPL